MTDGLIDHLEPLFADERAVALATLVVTENGARHGTLGDSGLDDAAAAIALDVLATGSRIATIDLAGVSRQYFFDRQSPPTTMVIVGAGQIAMSLTRMARELDMR